MAQKFLDALVNISILPTLKTDRSIISEKICNQELILYPLNLLSAMNIPSTIAIPLGQESIKDVIQKKYTEIVTISSKKDPFLDISLTDEEDLLICCGTSPLITKEIIEDLYAKHCTSLASITVATAHYDLPSKTYDRLITKKTKTQLIKATDFTGNPQQECSISGGVWIIKKSLLKKIIALKKESISLESCITFANLKKEKVCTLEVPFDAVRKVTTLEELWAVEYIKRCELIRNHMENGVRFANPCTAIIDLGVSIGAGSMIGAGAQLLGTTSIGKKCTIGAYTTISHSTMNANVNILPYSFIENSRIETGAKIGPYAHIHAQSSIKKNANISSFVDLKRSKVGTASAINPFSCLADTTIGKSSTINAGAITSSSQILQKQIIIVKDSVSVGINSSLIAPLTIESNAQIAAGSTITQDVPAHAIAVARTRQINKATFPEENKKATDKPKSIKPFIAAIKTEPEPQSV